MEQKTKYDLAKEAYYNGNPMMSDAEFDALEQELRLENVGYVGERVNSNFTIKHPFIMGSLSKIQVKEGVKWREIGEQIAKYIPKQSLCILTPKYDGCSFEAIFKNGRLESISTRGDGEYGKDITKHLEAPVLDALQTYVDGTVDLKYGEKKYQNFILRGEVLVDKNVWQEKYFEGYANPRAFVAGTLNAEYNSSTCFDLEVVIYDVRLRTNNSWLDVDWFEVNGIEKDWTPSISKVTSRYMLVSEPEFFYEFFEQERDDDKFMWDGFVIKPTSEFRNNNLTEARPKDCVAIKFKPSLQKTKVVDIIWQLGKTKEYKPVIVVEPVYMGGKEITRASAFNYGYLVENGLNVGSTVTLSLAGDIIPYIYQINETIGGELNIPENTYVDGVHLMAKLDEKDEKKLMLYNSILTANIKGLGPKQAERISQVMYNECGEKYIPQNIFELAPETIRVILGGRNGVKVAEIFEEYRKVVSLKEIIKSFNFKLCGDKVSEEIAKYLTNKPYNFTSMPSEGYDWALKKENIYGDELVTPNKVKLEYVLECLEKTYEDFMMEEKLDQIPVIMTGSPNQYKTKKDFLELNPQYKETSKWNEVKILFTDSLTSTSSKMAKANKLGIEIRLY